MNRMRLDIQGLRAIAALMVVGGHLSVGKVPGGYLGVDIFFVISGYLITQHLLKEVVETGTVSLTHFWARRIRRLLPAAYLVLGATAVLAPVLLPRALVVDQYLANAGAAAYLFNWLRVFNIAQGSFTGHFWTLSAEEQFYALWPLMILLSVVLARRSAPFSKNAIQAAITTLVVVISLTYAAIEVRHDEWTAFLATTTRAWEFGVGGLVAMLRMSGKTVDPSRGGFHLIASWVGALGLLLAFVFPGAKAPNTIPLTLPWAAVLSSALLVWLGDSSSSLAPQALLHPRPVQFLGDVSYGIYLWHVPLIAVFAALIPGHGALLFVAKAFMVVGGSIALAAASKYLLEDPIRHARGVLSRRWVAFSFMAAGLAVFSALAAAV